MKKKILIGFEIVMILLPIIGVIAWHRESLLFESAVSFQHGQTVNKAYDSLTSNLDRALYFQNAYFFTGETKFLKERDLLLLDIRRQSTELVALAVNDSLQEKSVASMHAMVGKNSEALIASDDLIKRNDRVAAVAKLKEFLDGTNEIRQIISSAKWQSQESKENIRVTARGNLKEIAYAILTLLALSALASSLIRRSMYRWVGGDNTTLSLKQSLLTNVVLQDAIFNSRKFSSIATDTFGIIQIFNVGAEQMLGYRAAEVIDKMSPDAISDPLELIQHAKNLSAEMHAEIAPGFDALVYKASRSIGDVYDLTYIRKDGTRIPASVSVTALRDSDDLIIGYLLIGIDNSARKKVEEEQAVTNQQLRDLQFYTRSLFESNFDALMATDAYGLISDINQQMEKLTGCTREELIGLPSKNLFTEPELAQTALTRVMQEGEVTDFELTARALDGKETFVSYNAKTFYDRDSLVQGVFASVRNVSERKQFEITLQDNNLELKLAKAVAEKANLAKSEFLSSMSHELRTPLNAILGFAQLMASENPPPSISQKQSIDQILQGGWYLLRLINEILDLALIESGKVSISQEAMSLTEVLQDCQSMIEPQAQKRAIQMSFPDFEKMYYVHADRTRVKQVLINLLSNAIKYNREGGRVFVECRQSGENKIRLSITDTGAGLSHKQLQQLFQPFNRLGQESGNEEGTGIGLVVTKQLVALMGGEIGVESQVGVGSVFWIELNASSVSSLSQFSDFTLPVHLGNRVSATVLGSTSESAKRTLLYVEDNPANLALVEQLVARCPDLRLLSAVDGHLGIQMARVYLPDVILMDINLPGISGLGALMVLKRDALTAHIPILALSANAMQRDIENGINAGFYRYLTKPIRVNEFMEALQDALAHAVDQEKTKSIY